MLAPPCAVLLLSLVTRPTRTWLQFASSFQAEEHTEVSQSASYCCGKHEDQKQLGEKRDYFILQIAIHRERNLDRNSRQEPRGRELKQRPWRKCCLLACSACFFVYNPGSPAQEWHHPQWAESFYINQKDAPTDVCTVQCFGGIFSTELPSVRLADQSGLKLTILLP